MLGDDIIEGTKSATRTVAHAIGNTFKGALVIGAAAAAGAALFVVGAAFFAGTGGLAAVGAMLATEGSALLALQPAVGANFVGACAAYGAIAGGAISGVTSLLPGKDEMSHGIRKLFSRGERSEAPRQEVVYQQAPAPRTQTVIVDQPAPQAKPNVVYRQAAPQPPETVVVDVPAPQQRNVVYRQAAAPQTQTILETAPAQGTASTSVSVQFPQENPYYKPGHGAEMMQRGNDRSNESILSK